MKPDCDDAQDEGNGEEGRSRCGGNAKRGAVAEGMGGSGGMG